MNLIHSCDCLDCCSWRFASVVLLLLAQGFLVSSLAIIPALASNKGFVCPRVSFRLLVVFLALAFLFAFPFLALLTPFPQCLSFAQYPSALTCQESCAAQGHHRFLCQRPLSHVSRHGLVRLAICQGNHFQEITVGCWRVFHHSRYLDRLLEVCTAAILNCATSFSQEASMSPRSRPSLCIFSHLARGLRIPLKSTSVRFPPLPSYSSLSTRHANNPKRRGTKGTRDRALPSHFVMSKA